MPDHPQYAMWKARLEAEQVLMRERAARQIALAAKRQELDKAWIQYRKHWYEGFLPGRGLPAWWQIRAWLRLLFGKPP